MSKTSPRCKTLSKRCRVVSYRLKCRISRSISLSLSSSIHLRPFSEPEGRSEDLNFSLRSYTLCRLNSTNQSAVSEWWVLRWFKTPKGEKNINILLHLLEILGIAILIILTFIFSDINLLCVSFLLLMDRLSDTTHWMVHSNWVKHTNGSKPASGSFQNKSNYIFNHRYNRKWLFSVIVRRWTPYINLFEKKNTKEAQ